MTKKYIYQRVCNCECGCRIEFKSGIKVCYACYKSKRKYGVCQGRQQIKHGDRTLENAYTDKYSYAVPGPDPERVKVQGHCIQSRFGPVTTYPECLYKGKRLRIKDALFLKKNGYYGDMQVLHKCSNKRCIRSDHLYLGMPPENGRDREVYKEMPRGEDHPRVKLSDADVVNIRQAYASGNKTQREIAEDFGVSQMYISDIVNFKYRKDARYPVWTQEQQQEFRESFHSEN